MHYFSSYQGKMLNFKRIFHIICIKSAFKFELANTPPVCMDIIRFVVEHCQYEPLIQSV
ncbi:MAG: hypothetical protein KIIPBIDF_00777 [Candidatus Methanoperedenaceae archaeon GB50]|nr:MAG: hypothetical protein KIIPBIDF_00777 [Candidatus Methanoperedenaceae archaeon GB50]